jgi:hypothetical protein
MCMLILFRCGGVPRPLGARGCVRALGVCALTRPPRAWARVRASVRARARCSLHAQGLRHAAERVRVRARALLTPASAQGLRHPSACARVARCMPASSCVCARVSERVCVLARARVRARVCVCVRCSLQAQGRHHVGGVLVVPAGSHRVHTGIYPGVCTGFTPGWHGVPV